MKKTLLILAVFVMFFSLWGVEKEKERFAVMDVQDTTGTFDQNMLRDVTDYIFTRFQSTGLYWLIPKADRDAALEQAMDQTLQETRKECVDEKCQLSLVAQLQANYIINTKIKKLFEGTCQISISKFDVEKRAGVFSWEEKFNCNSEKAVYETIDGFDFGGMKKIDKKKTEKPLVETVKTLEKYYPYKWIGFGLVIAGAAIVVGGVTGFSLASQNKYDEYEGLTTDEKIFEAVTSGIPQDEYLKKVNDYKDKGDLYKNLSIVSGVAGGALIITGVIIAVIPKKREVLKDVSFMADDKGFYASLGFEF